LVQDWLGLVFRFSDTQPHYGAIVPLCTVVFYMDPRETPYAVRVSFSVDKQNRCL